MLAKFSFLMIMTSLLFLIVGLPNEKNDNEWWSLQPLKSVNIPDPDQTNPLDSFILSKLEEQGLKKSVKADRRVLIRRLYFDLWGMPPTPDDIKTFVNDPHPNAYGIWWINFWHLHVTENVGRDIGWMSFIMEKLMDTIKISQGLMPGYTVIMS